MEREKEANVFLKLQDIIDSKMEDLKLVLHFLNAQVKRQKNDNLHNFD